jgi:hypothetical protein
LAAISFTLLEFNHSWSDIQAAWYALYQVVEKPCVFFHPAILGSTSILPPASQPTHLAVGYLDGELVFGLPVRITPQAWFPGSRGLELFGAEGFDHIAPLDCTNWAAFRQFLFTYCPSQHINWIYGNQVSANTTEWMDSAYRDSPRLFVRQAYRCPYLALPTTFEALLQGLSSNFRDNLKYLLRKTNSLNIEFRIVSNSLKEDTLQDACDQLFRLHTARFSHQERNSKFSQPHMRRFIESICLAAREYPGLVQFTEAIYQGQVIGSLLGYLDREVFFFLQHGFDPAYAKYSPGSLLILKTMENLISRGVDNFDFLRGMDAYKTRWTQTASENFTIAVALNSSGYLSQELWRLNRAIRRQGRLAGLLARIQERD